MGNEVRAVVRDRTTGEVVQEFGTGVEAPGPHYSEPIARQADHDYLEQARRAVVERGAAYGTPKDNHDATAAFWQAYFDRRFRGGPVRVDAEDVCVLMILQKICREANERKPDNMVDVCGYAQNIGMIRQANEAKE